MNRLALFMFFAATSAAMAQSTPGTRIVEEQIWVPAEYRTVVRRDWIAPEFRISTERRWIPEQHHTRTVRQWVPPQYTEVVHNEWIAPQFETACIPVRAHCGAIIGYRHVTRQVPGTGQYVPRTERVLVPGTGEHAYQEVRELVPGTGRWVTEQRREQILGTGQWVERQVRELVPGTGEYRTVARTEMIPQTPPVEPVPMPRPAPQPEPAPLPAELLRATGHGAMRDGPNLAQSRLLALRAARLDALRKLAEQVQGVKIDANTTVRDYVTLSDAIATSVQAYIQGAREVDSRIHPDGTAEVTVELSVDGLRSEIARHRLPQER